MSDKVDDILADALNRAGSSEGPKLRAAIASTDIPGSRTIMPWSRVKFGEDGQSIGADPVPIQYIGGSFVTIFPKGVAAASARWPMNS